MRSCWISPADNRNFLSPIPAGKERGTLSGGLRLETGFSIRLRFDKGDAGRFETRVETLKINR
jgi:hypothetical protein